MMGRETLAFLCERGLDSARVFRQEEKQLLARAHEAFYRADALVVRLGGKAGRLGESIVATALLEGFLQALVAVGKTGTPVTIIVDAGVGDLFDTLAYQDAYWPRLQIITSAEAEHLDAQSWRSLAFPVGFTLLVDLHGAHDGMPYLEEIDGDTALMHLSRAGIRYYARHKQLRRYADFIQDLLALPPGTVDPALAQPRIRLGALTRARYSTLAQAVSWHTEALHIVGFFQSIVTAKCYQHWDEVLAELADQVALRWPGRQMEILLACGPDEQQPAGFHMSDLIATFAGFTGTRQNALVRVEQIPSLGDLAVLLSRASLVLSNDTGPGHLAGALSIPTITTFLPGGVYSKEVWASSLWHHGITLEPSPFTTEAIESAVIWGDTAVINRIPPESIVAETLACLLADT
jgi:Glycosyltransferase family 9 (heptosyltransferase)